MILNKVVGKQPVLPVCLCQHETVTTLRANKLANTECCKQLDSKKRLDSEKASPYLQTQKNKALMPTVLTVLTLGVFAIRPIMCRGLCVNKYNGRITTKNEENKNEKKTRNLKKICHFFTTHPTSDDVSSKCVALPLSSTPVHSRNNYVQRKKQRKPDQNESKEGRKPIAPFWPPLFCWPPPA